MEFIFCVPLTVKKVFSTFASPNRYLSVSTYSIIFSFLIALIFGD
jgi:hypothetical protein